MMARRLRCWDCPLCNIRILTAPPPPDPQSKSKLAGLPDTAIFEVDLARGGADAFLPAFSGCDAVVIATSGVPVLKPLSLIPVFWAKLTGKTGVSPEVGPHGASMLAVAAMVCTACRMRC